MIKDTIAYAGQFFKNGSESFRKIDELMNSIKKAQIDVNIYTQYMTRTDDYKTTANIIYLPNPTKYYIFGITSYRDYSVSNPQKTSKVYVNAEIGKRYDNLLLRGGIIESTGGVGVDYFLDNDRIKFTTDLYDFNSENDIRGKNPHLDFRLTYLYLKHLELIAGVDNILNTKARTFFMGLGVKFRDNDLKPFLSGGVSSFLK
jgi:phospholipid/cholesterol/gamma-HCH transport system substrate-binding protein